MSKPIKLKKILPLLEGSLDVEIYAIDEDDSIPVYKGDVYNIPWYLLNYYFSTGGSHDFNAIDAFATVNDYNVKLSVLQLFVAEDPDFILKEG